MNHQIFRYLIHQIMLFVLLWSLKLEYFQLYLVLRAPLDEVRVFNE